MSDWLSAVSGPYRPAFVALLRELPFDRVQSMPQPKRSGLPLGREAMVLGRFLRGGDNALHPSALAAVYHATRPASERLLFRGFVLGDALSRHEWATVLPTAAVAEWERRGLLGPADGDRLAAPFRVIPVRGRRLLADTQDERFLNRVHIGQDSMNTLEFLERRPVAGRLLDVGTGTGILLLCIAARTSSAVGIDINPRAIEIARLNAEINGVANVTIEQCDAFAAHERFATFDQVVWNAPFVFFPPDQRAVNLDGDGGDLGIELTLRFVARLRQLLNPGGQAHIMSAAPVLRDGSNLLEERLRVSAAEHALDVELFVVQDFWDSALREFHAAYGIARFESVILRVRPGAGRFRRREAPALRRGSDAVRGLYYGRVRR